MRLDTPLVAFRIADSRHAIFSGDGAAFYGGRWNSPGRPVVYCSLTLAGAMLEQLAKAGIGTIPKRQQWVEVTIAVGTLVEELKNPPTGWDGPDISIARSVGDDWLSEARSVALIVPSVVGKPVERSLLVNPAHADLSRVTISAPSAVQWDDRFGRSR